MNKTNGATDILTVSDRTKLSFLYDGHPYEDEILSVQTDEKEDRIETQITLRGGLCVTRTLTYIKKYEAWEVVDHFANLSDTPTGVITELWDCDLELDAPKCAHRVGGAYIPESGGMLIYNPMGSVWNNYEFSSMEERIFAGETRSYECRGGRSSDLNAPFFRIDLGDGHGLFYAVGWSGQWHADITRTENSVKIRSKVADTDFYLLPGESFRTSSAVIMLCEGDAAHAHNKWRRLVKEHFSLIGRPGRGDYGPFCAGIWGGMTTDEALARVRAIKNAKLPFEYVWMDAGWYGETTLPTPDEFEGDWWSHTGDWTPAPAVHPDGLIELSKEIHGAGMKFLLWFEPERVISGTPVIIEHPEYFIHIGGDENPANLLDLGNPDAWQYIFSTLCSLIDKIGIDCLRQDFNFEPLEYWRSADGEHRRGVTEIKHICGLYKLWDALLEVYPSLIIDNCASGGRRIDIETLRRSMPLWRSDMQCPANYSINGVQSHHISFNMWMPFSGSGSGRPYDGYRIRSAYDSSMTTNYTFSAREKFGDDPEKLDLLRKHADEYLALRPYFSADMFPMTIVSDKSDVWSAVQFNRPEQGDGILQVFRREDSPYTLCSFALCDLVPDATYTLSDMDGDDPDRTFLGSELMNGVDIRVARKRSAKIYRYHVNS